MAKSRKPFPRWNLGCQLVCLLRPLRVNLIPAQAMNDHLDHLRQRLASTRRGGSGRQLTARTPRPRPDNLQLLAAELLLVTGIGTALEGFRQRRASDRDEGADFDAAGLAGSWAPAVLGPLAAIAHVACALAPTQRNRTAARVLDVAAVGGALAAIAGSLAGTGRRSPAPLSPLALASAGALGLLLDHAASEREAERERLERRANIVERLVPKRRPRLDRIVVHV